MHGPISDSIPDPLAGTPAGTALRTSRYRVSGMDCGSCAAKIETALRRVPGIHEVRVSVPAGTVTVSHETMLAADAVVRPLTALGYGATPADAAETAGSASCGGGCCGTEAQPHSHAHSHDHSHDHSHGHDDASEAPWWRGRKARLTLAAGEIGRASCRERV